MGSGDFSGNQSVHWKITMDDSPNGKAAVHGRDGLGERGFDQIGKGSHGGKTHAGHFEVSLRFDSADAAKAALEAAVKGITSHSGHAIAKVRVKAINRSSPDVNPPAEVKVDW